MVIMFKAARVLQQRLGLLGIVRCDNTTALTIGQYDSVARCCERTERCFEKLATVATIDGNPVDTVPRILDPHEMYSDYKKQCKGQKQPIPESFASFVGEKLHKIAKEAIGTELKDMNPDVLLLYFINCGSLTGLGSAWRSISHELPTIIQQHGNPKVIVVYEACDAEQMLNICKQQGWGCVAMQKFTFGVGTSIDVPCPCNQDQQVLEYVKKAAAASKITENGVLLTFCNSLPLDSNFASRFTKNWEKIRYHPAGTLFVQRVLPTILNVPPTYFMRANTPVFELSETLPVLGWKYNTFEGMFDNMVKNSVFVPDHMCDEGFGGLSQVTKDVQAVLGLQDVKFVPLFPTPAETPEYAQLFDALYSAVGCDLTITTVGHLANYIVHQDCDTQTALWDVLSNCNKP